MASALPILLTALLIFFSFPPFASGFLAYVALVPFLWLLEGRTPMEGLRLGYVTGLAVIGVVFYWLNWNTGATAFQATGMYLGTVFYLALAWGLFGWWLTWSRRLFGRTALVMAPVTWTALDFLQSLGELGFSWHSPATSQTGYPAAIQFVEFTGMYGLTCWIGLLNVLAFMIVRRLWLRNAALTISTAAAVLLVPWLYGVIRLNTAEESERSIRVVIIQPNIEPNRKWLERDFAFEETMRLTSSRRREGADLIVWPETAIPNRLRNDMTKLDAVYAEIKRWPACLLTGIPDRRWTKEDGRGVIRSYNSVFLLRPDTTLLQSYDKIHLVPFGEHVPGFLAFMKDIAMTIGVPDYEAGNDPAVFTVPLFRNGTAVDSVNVAPVICLESVYAHMVRATVVRGARILVIVTNDAWYDGTTGPAQHNRIAVLRAVENGIPVVRCANSGVSSIIDPRGRVLAETESASQAALAGDVPLGADRRTFFTRAGWVFPWLTVFGAIGFVAAGIRKGRQT